MCSTFASDQCLKNESDKLQVFLVVGLKNLERNTLWINLFRISNPNPNANPNRRRLRSHVATYPCNYITVIGV